MLQRLPITLAQIKQVIPIWKLTKWNLSSNILYASSKKKKEKKITKKVHNNKMNSIKL